MEILNLRITRLQHPMSRALVDIWIFIMLRHEMIKPSPPGRNGSMYSQYTFIYRDTPASVPFSSRLVGWRSIDDLIDGPLLFAMTSLSPCTLPQSERKLYLMTYSQRQEAVRIKLSRMHPISVRSNLRTQHCVLPPTRLHASARCFYVLQTVGPSDRHTL